MVELDEASTVSKVQWDELPYELDTVNDNESVDMEYLERLEGYSPVLCTSHVSFLYSMGVDNDVHLTTLMLLWQMRGRLPLKPYVLLTCRTNGCRETWHCHESESYCHHQQQTKPCAKQLKWGLDNESTG